MIKALMGLCAFGIAKLFMPFFKKAKFVAYIISGILAEAIMVVGYFVYEATVMSYGLGAAVSVIPNIIQGVVGITVGVILITVLNKTKLIDKMMRK